MARVCKMAISLPKEHFERLELMRDAMGVGRSEIIDMAICSWLKSIEERKLIQLYENGYIRKPEVTRDIRALEKAGLEVLDLEDDWK